MGGVVIRYRAVAALGARLNPLVADALALFVKTKGHAWNASGAGEGPHHDLLKEVEAGLLETAEALAERVRLIGARTIDSLGHAMKLQSVADCDDAARSVEAMLLNLAVDNQSLAAHMQAVRWFCEECEESDTADLLAAMIAAAERRSSSLTRAAAALPGGLREPVWEPLSAARSAS